MALHPGNPDIAKRLLQAMLPHLAPELLAPAWRSGWSAANPTRGFCSVASEAAWFLLGGGAGGWLPCVGRDDSGGTHWWLEACDGGMRIDPTADQYFSRGATPPYARGHHGTFMGQRRDPDSPFGFGMRPGLRAGRLLAGLLGGEATPDSAARMRRQIGISVEHACAPAGTGMMQTEVATAAPARTGGQATRRGSGSRSRAR